MDTLHLIFLFSCCFCIIHGQVNVAVDQPTSQLSDLEWMGFAWTSDKAVDGRTDRDQPDTQMSCSSSQDVPGQIANFWRVDMTSPATVSTIVIYGRGDASGSTQLSGFTVDVTSTPGGQETQVHDNAGLEYGEGMFTVEMGGQVVSSVIIRRPSILTLCEVQVFTLTSGASSTVSMGSTQSTASMTMSTSATVGASSSMTTQGGATSPGMTTQMATGSTSPGMTTQMATGASSPGMTTQATTGNSCGRATGHLHVCLSVYGLWTIISCMWRTS